MEYEGIVFLLFLHLCSGLEVVAPRTHNALIGSTTLVPCSFTVDNPPIKPQFLAVLWQYGERELLRYDNKEKSAISRMFLDDEGARRGNASLTITNVTIDDRGIYKCFVIYSPNREVKEVHLGVQAVPQVTLMKKALSKNGKNRLLCLITDFYPKDITVTWLRNGQTLAGSELGPFQVASDGTYRVNSSLTITESQYQPIITCQVEHASLQEPIRDTFTAQYGEEPEITFFSSKDGDDEVFVCDVKGFHPDTAEIIWLLDGERTEPPRRNTDGTFNTWDHFLIPGDQKKPRNISCVVEHETLYSPLVRTLPLAGEKNSLLPMFITRVLVLLLGLCVLSAAWLLVYKKCLLRMQLSSICVPGGWASDQGGTVTLFCTASDCRSPARATWTVVDDRGEKVRLSDPRAHSDGEGGQLLSGDYMVKTGHSQADGLYNSVTSLTFTPSGLQRMTVTCSFLCGGTTREKTLQWSSRCDFRRCLELDDITVTSLVHGREATLQCVIRRDFPEAMEVEWFRTEAGRPGLYKVSSCDKYKIPEMEVTQESKTFTSIARLYLVSVSALTEQGAEFVCRVTPRSLGAPLEKRTGTLTVTEIPFITSSVENDKFIILEVKGFYTPGLVITWEQADKGPKRYKKIEDRNIRNTKTPDKDGGYVLSSKCDVSRRVPSLTNEYFKATVRHGALRTPEEIVFLRSKGSLKILEQTQKNSTNFPSSERDG